MPQAHDPVWLLTLEFVAAALVMAALVAGPQIWETGGRLRSHWQQDHTSAPVEAPSLPGPAASAPSAPARAAAATEATVPVPAAPEGTVIQPPEESETQRAPAARPVAKRMPRIASEVLLTAPPPGLTPQQYYDSLMRQGFELYQSGWFGPAMGRFRQAALVIPSSPSPLLWQARAAMKIGRYGEARQALERAVALAPASEAAREARVMLEWFK